MSAPRTYPQPPVTNFTQFDEDYEDSSDYDSEEDDYSDDYESGEEERQVAVAPPPPAPVVAQAAPLPQPVPVLQETAPPPITVTNNHATGNHSENYDMTEYSNYDAPHIVPVSPKNVKREHNTVETVQVEAPAIASQTEDAEPKHSVPSSLMSTPYARGLQVAVSLALHAGKNLKAGGEDERHIVEGLSKAFPQHRVIGKEAVGKSMVPMLTQVYPTWFVDATNGAGSLRSPMACVTVGMCLKGQPVIGIVFNPFTEELFVAADGFGAFLNGEKIRVSQSALGLAAAVVGYEFGKGKEKYKMLNAVGRIMEHGCAATRSLGSVPMNLCYVASGRMHGTYAGIVPSEGWKPWDFCAGLVIAKEAGCHVSAIRNYGNKEEYDMYCGSIICAVNASLVSEIRHCVSQ
ncbi:hypothetical protein FisN_3Lh351 [Fistulifera solaris]|uniref:Inositol-phosphate phosphatase n=1 Tax=Fistulifera solaris TaxID=1519565 RepID=A0A1Z5J838_FISSO|nr:hypothetical protein FisN_3Lh351 [Fistulifera solaris]|eukprot:GAX10155.1 hypothetical protein FisN_3Lh351 [Fistulifera solaris]